MIIIYDRLKSGSTFVWLIAKAASHGHCRKASTASGEPGSQGQVPPDVQKVFVGASIVHPAAHPITAS